MAATITSRCALGPTWELAAGNLRPPARFSPQISLTLLTEVLKFGISLTFYLLQPVEKRSHRELRARDALLFAVPSFLYFVNNNLIFVILMYVNSTTFQILSSLKTVFTAIFFRALLKRTLAEVQWASVLLLACGAAVSQFPICPVCTPQSASGAEPASDTAPADVLAVVDPGTVWLGVATAVFACVLSALAGVYSELLLKKDGQRHAGSGRKEAGREIRTLQHCYHTTTGGLTPLSTGGLTPRPAV